MNLLKNEILNEIDRTSTEAERGVLPAGMLLTFKRG